MKPKYKHDCPICQFLGTIKSNSNDCDTDLYYCDQAAIPTVLARYSSEGARS